MPWHLTRGYEKVGNWTQDTSNSSTATYHEVVLSSNNKKIKEKNYYNTNINFCYDMVLRREREKEMRKLGTKPGT